ncbi:hypothetical protein Cadr_000023848 [Camelus dromedarius]|uniref:Uncharacterized protein n=1 Tax=Camelus dromedarius TaxID=9838 RepID=A0A5N4CXX0_CAMDR|nr:hypothetical protein Cadr_000023848 [Camelus dromedarius]
MSGTQGIFSSGRGASWDCCYPETRMTVSKCDLRAPFKTGLVLPSSGRTALARRDRGCAAKKHHRDHGACGIDPLPICQMGILNN